MLTDDPDYRPTDQDFLLAESMNHPECTDDADTHCRSFTVDGPPGNTAGIYTVTVDATDDDGTPFIYTLIADDGLNPLRRVIQPENNVLEIFLFPGFWTLSVVVDDDRLCDDEANDNTCIGEPFEVFPGDDPCAAEVPGAAEATLEAAFTFQHDAFSCPVFNDQGIDYLPVAQTDPLFIEYDPALGYGYERVYPDLNDLPYGERGGYGVFGPMDETPNDRDRFGDGCPDELYDSFIGGKDFDLGCAGVIDNTVPCDPPEGIIFRVDVPNGRYRFVAAVGDSENEHAHRILVEDGGEGPPDVIGPNSVVLVENFDQAEHGEGVFARVGFDGRIPPPGSGFPPPGVAFVNMDADGLATEACPSSPTLEVTEKYIRIHQLKGSSIGTDANGGDLVVLEIWSVEGGPEPTGFVRGDADSNGSINLTDGIVILNFLFLGGPAPPCLDAADTDDDGGQRPTLTDAVIVFQWLFSGGEPPRPPSPGLPDYAPGECGPDTTDDEMDCATLAAKCTP